MAEKERTNEQLKLRVTATEAEKIRFAAAKADSTISQFVVDGLRVKRPAPIAMQQFDALTEVSRRLVAIPNAVRDLDTDLKRFADSLTALFRLDYGKAMAHHTEIHAALESVAEVRANIVPALAEIQAAVAGPRDEIAAIVTEIVRDRQSRAG